MASVIHLKARPMQKHAKNPKNKYQPIYNTMNIINPMFPLYNNLIDL